MNRSTSIEVIDMTHESSTEEFQQHEGGDGGNEVGTIEDASEQQQQSSSSNMEDYPGNYYMPHEYPYSINSNDALMGASSASTSGVNTVPVAEEPFQQQSQSDTIAFIQSSHLELKKNCAAIVSMVESCSSHMEALGADQFGPLFTHFGDLKVQVEGINETGNQLADQSLALTKVTHLQLMQSYKKIQDITAELTTAQEENKELKSSLNLRRMEEDAARAQNDWNIYTQRRRSETVELEMINVRGQLAKVNSTNQQMRGQLMAAEVQLALLNRQLKDGQKKGEELEKKLSDANAKLNRVVAEEIKRRRGPSLINRLVWAEMGKQQEMLPQVGEEASSSGDEQEAENAADSDADSIAAMERRFNGQGGQNGNDPEGGAPGQFMAFM